MNFDKFNPLSNNFIYRSSSSSNTTTKEPSNTNNATTNLLNSEVSDWGIDEDFTPNTGTTFSTFLSPTSSVATSTNNKNFQQHQPPNYLQNRQPSNYNSQPLQQSFDDYIPPNPSYMKSVQRRNSSISNSSYYNQQHNNVHQSPLNPHQHLHRSHSQQSLNAIQVLQQSGTIINPTTESLSKFIKKYLSMEKKMGEFWEKFRYSLIISNLLEDSMILSENESSLQVLKSDLDQQQLRNFKYTINDDGTKLIVTNTSYRVTYNLLYSNFGIIIIFTNLIIFLLKQQQNLQLGRECMNNVLQFKLFKIILYLSSKLIKIQKFKVVVETNKILNFLNKFLKSNYTVNKNLILNIIKIKGSNLNLELQVNKRQLSNFLLNSLNFLIMNLNILIMKLIPMLNGEIFEQYCVINNINLGILTQEYENDDNNEVQEVVFYINKFNQLRKLFICQLITINENAQGNFFVLNLMDQFQVSEESKDVNNLEKCKILAEVLMDYNKTMENINDMFKKYEIHKIEIHDRIEETNLNSNLNQFISKVSNFNQNLRFFQKYNSSLSVDNFEEQQEKISIFNQFNTELSNLKLLHKQTLLELNQEINPDYVVSQKSLSNLSSPSQTTTPRDSFNLKTFQNSSLKKRFSLPSSANSPSQSQVQPQVNSSQQPQPKQKKKYKRLSTGLPLGLLTVFEENKQNLKANRESLISKSSSDSNQQNSILSPPLKVSYDDNYLNILPNLNQYESYNKSTLDQLNRKSNSNGQFPLNNRFSINSVQSNVSGITDLISTQLTSYKDSEEDQDNESNENENSQLTQEALKKKLEESFNKIYDLTNENKKLKNKASETTINLHKQENNIINEKFNLPNNKFLNDLEMKLNF
ncbi:hypothetical protein KGF54_002126 [Candida jiufengensis]|uniref:uncharacterized protein n=1 Tax=Candida jiufengensis TaxID=497108 RepID=UPI002225A52E|nr:uncharacterized protein KGF54_002126 [Candida jiufengensis]KAI5954351.1 hypothetical protein KGF54_002126 [Candida jiufengensis]